MKTEPRIRKQTSSNRQASQSAKIQRIGAPTGLSGPEPLMICVSDLSDVRDTREPINLSEAELRQLKAKTGESEPPYFRISEFIALAIREKLSHENAPLIPGTNMRSTSSLEKKDLEKIGDMFTAMRGTVEGTDAFSRSLINELDQCASGVITTEEAVSDFISLHAIIELRETFEKFEDGFNAILACKGYFNQPGPVAA